MASSRTIRVAKEEDEPSVLELLNSASSARTTSNEARVYQSLRSKELLTLSLLSLDDEGKLLGYAALSPVEVHPPSQPVARGWYALGPIFVARDQRRRGIGTELIQIGLELLERDHEAKGVVASGFPSFLRRDALGFKNAADQGLQAPEGSSSTYFWARTFERDEKATRGTVKVAW